MLDTINLDINKLYGRIPKEEESIYVDDERFLVVPIFLKMAQKNKEEVFVLGSYDYQDKFFKVDYIQMQKIGIYF